MTTISIQDKLWNMQLFFPLNISWKEIQQKWSGLIIEDLHSTDTAYMVAYND